MNKEYNQEQTTIKKELSFLSMQVIWSLPEDTTLSEEIEKMMSITFSGIAYNIEMVLCQDLVQVKMRFFSS